MKLAKKADILRRKEFYRLEQENKKQKFFCINMFNFQTFKKSNFLSTVLFLSQLKIKKSNKIKLIRRCVLNNRSKSIRKFSMSRIVLREYLLLGLMPGYTKCSW
jgi:ribosomal protein S14